MLARREAEGCHQPPSIGEYFWGQGREAKALRILTRLNGPVAAAATEIHAALAAERDEATSLFQPRLYRPLRIAVVPVVLQ